MKDGSELDELSVNNAEDPGKETKSLIKVGQFYYYENKWYIGEVQKATNEDTFALNFLEELKDGSFSWPKKPDVDKNVSRRFILFGPIDLIGDVPYQLEQSDKASIKKIYKNGKFEVN